jgi:hypothetical protein
MEFGQRACREMDVKKGNKNLTPLPCEGRGEFLTSEPALRGKGWGLGLSLLTSAC